MSTKQEKTSSTKGEESKSLTLNQLKYAIDHETGVLSSHSQPSLDLEDGVIIEDVKIVFEGNQFRSAYKSKNCNEMITIEIGRGGVFRVSHENITKGVMLRVVGKDLRSVEFELRRVGQHRVERNEPDKKTGKPVMRQYTAIARANDLNSEYITEVIGSLRSLLRNREKGETALAKEKNNERKEKTRGYQNERQAILQELRDEIRKLQEEHEVELIKGIPKTNVESVQSFTKAGLRAVGSKTKTLSGLSKLLKSAKLFDTESAKSEYKSMVNAAQAGIGVTKKYGSKLDHPSSSKKTKEPGKSDETSKALEDAKKVSAFYKNKVTPVFGKLSPDAKDEYLEDFRDNLEEGENFIEDGINSLSKQTPEFITNAVTNVCSELTSSIVSGIQEYITTDEEERLFNESASISSWLETANKSKSVDDKIKAMGHLLKEIEKRISNGGDTPKVSDSDGEIDSIRDLTDLVISSIRHTTESLKKSGNTDMARALKDTPKIIENDYEKYKNNDLGEVSLIANAMAIYAQVMLSTIENTSESILDKVFDDDSLSTRVEKFNSSYAELRDKGASYYGKFSTKEKSKKLKEAVKLSEDILTKIYSAKK